MGTSQADKAASHQRIVAAAAARFRLDGLDGVGVADLMHEAGLTHGGFYRHFEDREQLVAEAVDCALAQGSDQALAVTRVGGRRALHAFIDAYLSPAHRDGVETGCAVAGLAADVARRDDSTREAYSRQVLQYVDVLVGLLPPDADPGEARRRANVVLAAAVGGLSMARAVADRDVSGEILSQTSSGLKDYVDGLYGPDR